MPPSPKYTEADARRKTYDEIIEFARAGMARKLGEKYAPKPKAPEAPPAAPAEGGLDGEALAALEAALGAGG